MSRTTDQAFVQQFSDTVHDLAEQMSARLLETTDRQDVTGESFTVERIGSIAAPNTVADLYGDTPMDFIAHSRRWGYITDYDLATLLSETELARMRIDPRSSYVRKHASSMARGIDKSIIDALGGEAAEGKSAPTGVALPSGQKVAVNAGLATGGMTIAKLRTAAELLDAAEVDPMLNRYLVHNARMKAQLLATTEVTSSDFNTVRALVNGEIDTFLGFKFIHSEQLPTLATGVIGAYAFVEGAVSLGTAVPIQTDMSIRNDKRNTPQIYTKGSWGCVRREDELVVEIATETVPAD